MKYYCLTCCILVYLILGILPAQSQPLVTFENGKTNFAIDFENKDKILVKFVNKAGNKAKVALVKDYQNILLPLVRSFEIYPNSDKLIQFEIDKNSNPGNPMGKMTYEASFVGEDFGEPTTVTLDIRVFRAGDPRNKISKKEENKKSSGKLICTTLLEHNFGKVEGKKRFTFGLKNIGTDDIRIKISDKDLGDTPFRINEGSPLKSGNVRLPPNRVRDLVVDYNPDKSGYHKARIEVTNLYNKSNFITLTVLGRGMEITKTKTYENNPDPTPQKLEPSTEEAPIVEDIKLEDKPNNGQSGGTTSVDTIGATTIPYEKTPSDLVLTESENEAMLFLKKRKTMITIQIISLFIFIAGVFGLFFGLKKYIDQRIGEAIKQQQVALPLSAPKDNLLNEKLDNNLKSLGNLVTSLESKVEELREETHQLSDETKAMYFKLLGKKKEKK